MVKSADKLQLNGITLNVKPSYDYGKICTSNRIRGRASSNLSALGQIVIAGAKRPLRKVSCGQ